MHLFIIFLEAGKTEIKEPANAVFSECPCSGSQRVPSSCVCTLWENDMCLLGLLLFLSKLPTLAIPASPKGHIP